MNMTSHAGLELRAEGLSKSLGSSHLFEGVTFTVKAGGLLVVRGTNGSGKTTLLRMIAGLLDADEGVVQFNQAESSLKAIDLDAAIHYFGHHNALKTDQSVRANLVFWRDFLGGTGDLNEAATRLDIAHLLDLPVAALSAGQKRRAGFTRLLLAHRPVWLLDEPTSALDQTSTGIMEGLVSQHLQAGGLAVAATHLPFLDDQATTLELSSFSAGSPDSDPSAGDGW
ncbi:MAG: heme ABC exporter ATP-binding protein CcmA [Pseudomonadota bacterium]